MRSLLSIGLRLRKDRRAVTSLEYAMIGALIAAVVVAGVTQLGTKVLAFWTSASTVHL